VFVFAEYMPPWPGDEPFSCWALGSPRALQLWIVRGERSLLQMRTGAESASLCGRMLWPASLMPVREARALPGRDHRSRLQAC
jgi:hypothetical protein